MTCMYSYAKGRVCSLAPKKKSIGFKNRRQTTVNMIPKKIFSITVLARARQLFAMLKTDGVVHGCTCLEAGILLDIFTPMREDFVK